MSTRRGRRPGDRDTREEILAAARDLFAAKGFAPTSMRAVAGRAGVDPALVHHYFDSKDDLFLASLRVGFDPRKVMAQVVAAGPDGAGERVVRTLLAVWDDEATRTPLLGLVRGVVDPEGSRLVRDAVFGLILAPLADGLGIDQPERRLALLASQVMGLILLRYVVQVPVLATMPVEDVVASNAATLQHYLTGDLAVPIDGGIGQA